MAINPNNGVLDIINGTLRVTSLDVKQGSSVSLNALARNNVLLFDDQKSTTTFMPTVAGGYMSSTGVTRNTTAGYLELGTASDEGWVYWPLQLPNAWHTEFDMHVTTTGGVLTFSLFNTSEPNHTDFTNNDGGYKIVFDNTNNQIVIYWEGSVHKTVSIDLRSNDWQHVNVNYSQGATSISLAGKVVLTHEFTQNYQEFNSRYVGFSATAGTSHKIRHLRVHNGDKWLYTKTSNASDITYVSGNVGIGSLAPTELLDVHGNVHIAKDLTVDGNLRVSGTTTFIDSTNLVVEDPIIELAKGNTSDTIDAGLIVTRGASNVAIAFRGDEEELAFGYTQSGASGTDVTPIANGGLDVRVYGNLFANNLTTTANVDATYLKGDGSEITHVTLDQVVDYGNVTSNTIQLTNADVGLKATGNVEANYFVGNGSKLTGLVTDLQSVTDNGNTTSNTVQFTNATTALIADSNVGIGTSTPSANLHVMGYQYVNGPPTLANAFDHSDAPLTLTHGTPTSTTAIDDPKAVLHLTRDGTSGESYGARASFNLSRYENSGTASRSRLDVALADGTYAESTVMTLRADGKVGVGTDTPAYTLDVAGDINLSGDFYQGGLPFVSSLWTSGNDSLYYTTNNVGIGTNTAEYTLDVHGNANVGALTTTSVSGDGSALYGIQSSNVSDFASNVTRITNLETSNGHIWSNLESNVTTLRSEMASNTVTLRGDLQSNVTTLRSEMASNTVALRGDLQSNVTTLRDTAITFTGIKTFQNDVILESNLRVQGDLLVANTVNMTVSDPILELGSNNQNTGDIGLVMTRHGTSNSNVAVFFDETADALKLGYTLNGANDTTLELDSNALAVSVQGALTAASVSGDGSGLTSLNAGNVSSGTLGTARIPNLDAGKITTGTLTRPISTTTGTFSGDVGIGTTNPDYKLHIRSGTATALLLESDNGGTGYPVNIDFRNYDAQDPPGARISVIDDADYGSDITFNTKTGSPGTGSLSQRMIIQGDGNVGIGLTSPAFPLDVDGVSRSRGVVVNSSFNNNTARPALSSGSTHPSYEIRSLGGNGNVGSTGADDGFLRLRAGGGTGTNSASYIDLSGYSTYSGGDMKRNIVFGTLGTERMRIKENGNVGIGTTNPQDKLHVSNGHIRIDLDKALTLTSTDTFTYDGGTMPHYGLLWRGHTAYTGSRTMQIAGHGGVRMFTAGAERLTILNNGNVGINDSTPSYKLSVNGSFRVHGSVATFGSDGLLHINSRSTTHGSETVALQTVIDGRALTDANPGTYGGESRNVLALQPDGGYVGIGTASPGAKLDVNGDLTVSGKIYNYNYTEVDINAPATTSGSWTASNASSSWGDPKFNNTYDRYRYNDAPGYVEYTIPTGMKSAYVSQLQWDSGGYVDVHGVQSDGGLVFLRRINTRQAVENSNQGNPDQHDGQTITFAGSGLEHYSSIRLTNKLGRFHLDGLGFTPNENEGTEGTGMVHSAQMSDLDPNRSVLRGGSPTIYFRDTNEMSAMIHNNSNLLYILRGGTDTETWTQVNSVWPWIFNLSNNDSTCGGSLYCYGNVTAYSDIRHKSDIVKLENALEKVEKLNGYTYTRKNDGKRYTGLIAQEVLEVLPEAVIADEKGEYSLAYGNMAGLFVEAMKEMKSKLDTALARLDALENPH